MAKTNFSKVEDALAEGLQKISIEQYLAAAPSQKEIATALEREQVAARQRLLRLLLSELNYLQKQGQAVYQKFQIKKSWLTQLLEKPEKISIEDWEKIVQIKKQSTNYKKSLEVSTSSEEINEKLVKEQAKKHLTKRFNVNDKWLPL